MISKTGKQNQIYLKKADLGLYLYILISFIFLVAVGIRAVKGEIDFEFYVDSETYYEFMEEKFSINEIILLYPNMIGPTLILKFFHENFYFIYLFNVFILVYFYYTVNKLFLLDRKLFLFFLFLSPVLFGSLIAVNKEIITLLVIAFFLKYYKNKSFAYLLLAVLFSCLVRWQMALFTIALAGLLSRLNPFVGKPMLNICFFLLLVSCFYWFNLSSFDFVNEIAMAGAEDDALNNAGSGAFNILLAIQNSSPVGYAIVFIPKTLFLFIGLLSKYWKVFDTTDVYNNIIAFFQSVANFFLLLTIYLKKVSTSNLFIFCALVYCIVFVLSPIFAPRYLFPAYIFLALALANSSAEKRASHNNTEGATKKNSEIEFPS